MTYEKKSQTPNLFLKPIKNREWYLLEKVIGDSIVIPKRNSIIKLYFLYYCTGSMAQRIFPGTHFLLTGGE